MLGCVVPSFNDMESISSISERFRLGGIAEGFGIYVWHLRALSYAG